ncbi:polysaccharide biosynthesis tyrosine autokinase [Rapidithrix thailandica]|uniref:non-specific protein-tyrosine kinase n=1 Tax=Rapidithrix thailandica TaxID=413964 RepID=A0AAW9S6J5_9BACT
MTEYLNPQLKIQAKKEVNLLSEFDLERLLYVLRKSLPFIFLIILFSGLGTFLFLRWSKPVYQAESRIKLEFKSSSDLLQLEVGMFQEGIDAINLAGEMQLLKSNSIYDGVIDSLNLYVSYFVQGDLLSDERFQSTPFTVEYRYANPDMQDRNILVKIINEDQFRLSLDSENPEEAPVYTFSELIERPGLKVRILKNGSLQEKDLNENFYFVINSKANLYKYFDQNLEVAIDNRGANTLRISFQDHNRTKAIDIVRALNQNYLVKTIDNKNRVYEQSLNYLNAQLQITRDTLDRFEKALERYSRMNKITIKEDVSQVMERIREYEDAKLELRMDLENYEKIEQLIKSDSNTVYLTAIASLIGNTKLNELLDQLYKAEQDFFRLKGAYKESTFAFQQRKKAINNSKLELYEIIRLQKNFINKQIDEIRGEIGRLQASLYQNDQEDNDFKKLTKSYEIYEEISNIISTKLIEIGMAKAGTVPNFQVLDEANASSVPIYPVPVIIYAIGVVVAMFMSVGLVLLRYFMQNKITRVKELEKLIEAPILGVVPSYRKPMEYSQLVVGLNPKSSMSESFRSLRTNLDFFSTKHKQRLISVTSTVSGEGKTFVTLNLAGVIAMSEMKVIVVDLDLRKPKVHLAFNHSNVEGVSSVIIGKSTLDKCIQKASIPSLYYLTAGPLPPNPSELIMSSRFEDMVTELKEQFDVIIFDTPPVGIVTDGFIIMNKVDLPLYVVRAEYSKQTYANSINDLYHSKNIRHLSVILNDVSLNSQYGQYAYGYEGANGYYEDPPEMTSLWQRIRKKVIQ